jgi:hypothetical protein
MTLHNPNVDFPRKSTLKKMAAAKIGYISFKFLVISPLSLWLPSNHHKVDAFVVTSRRPRPSFMTSVLRDSKHQPIIEAINEVFPSKNLDQRIALSRKDGYWPYIEAGDEPPQELVYGEFDVEFFAHVVEHAINLYDGEPQVFCDLGSGTGRLVLTAAALYPWELVRGVELLPGIHDTAVEKLESCRSTTDSKVNPEVKFSEGSKNSAPSAQESYWRQYRRFSPSDDWLNQLSQSFDGEEDNKGELYLRNDAEDTQTTTINSSAYLSQTSALGDKPKLPLAPIELSCGSFDDPCEFFGDANMNQLSQGFDEEEDNKGVLYLRNDAEDTEATKFNSSAALSQTYALGDKHKLPLAPIKLSCGSFDDPYEFFGDANIVFCFSSTMPYHVMINMARAVGRQCRPGALIITTECQLPTGGTIDPVPADPNVPHGTYELELVEEMHGKNDATGGESIVFIHRLTKSLGTGHAIPRPQPTISDICYNAIQKLKENDTKNFLRKVSNQMLFVGLPDHWRPKLKIDDD